MSNKHEFKTIVVPYDGSDQAKHAFSMACDLIGDDPDAKLMLLHVVPSGMVGTMDNAEGNTIDGVPWALLDYETYKDVGERRPRSREEGSARQPWRQRPRRAYYR